MSEQKAFDTAAYLEAAESRVAALRARLRHAPEGELLELADLEPAELEPEPEPVKPPPVPVRMSANRPALPGLPPPRWAPVNPSTPPPPFKVLGRLGTRAD